MDGRHERIGGDKENRAAYRHNPFRSRHHAANPYASTVFHRWPSIGIGTLHVSKATTTVHPKIGKVPCGVATPAANQPPTSPTFAETLPRSVTQKRPDPLLTGQGRFAEARPPYATVYATSCGLPPPPLADVSGPPAGTSTVFPNTASGALVVVGSFFRNTIAPVARLSAISVPFHSVVSTRSFDTVTAPSGRLETRVSHSTAPVARFSASTSPPETPPPDALPSTEPIVVDFSATLMAAAYTLPSATAMLVSTPPIAPGSNV